MTVSARGSTDNLPGRGAVVVSALKISNRLSRALGRGRGTVAGGRVGLALDPRLLGELARGRRVALVSGTNGKTTTTRMLVAALGGASRPVASNDTGANMPAGHVAALAGSAPGTDAVLEVDEGYLGALIEDTDPRVVVLLNLSRDQLDRISEVRMLAERWRSALRTLLADRVITLHPGRSWWPMPTIRWSPGRQRTRRTSYGSGLGRSGATTRWAVRHAVEGSSTERTATGGATGVHSPDRNSQPGSKDPTWSPPQEIGVRSTSLFPATSIGPTCAWWPWPHRQWVIPTGPGSELKSRGWS